MPFIGNKPTAIPLSADDLEDNIITSAKIVDGTIATADIADANVTAAKLASGTVQNQSAFKNIIINGDMSIAQRGTSTSSVTSSGYYACDRWDTNISSLGTWTISQSTDVPSGQGFANSMKWDCTTADASPSASDNLIIQQHIEGQMLQYLKKGTASAESLTFSFWIKSNKTGTYTVQLRDMDNSRHICKQFTISSANTWEKKTLTFAGDTSGAFDNDNAKSLQLDIYLGAGSNFTSGTLASSWSSYTQANTCPSNVNLADSTSNELYFTGVQLEAGTSASDFEFLPYDINKTRCERYYEVRRGGVSKPTTGGFSVMTEQFTVNTENMRTTPSYTYSDLANDTGGTATFKQFGNYWQQTNYGIPSGTAHYINVKFDAEL